MTIPATTAQTVGSVAVYLIEAYILVLFLRALLSWFPIDPWSPWRRLTHVLETVTEPVIRPVRRLIPPIGGIDVSFIVVVIACYVAIRVIYAVD